MAPSILHRALSFSNVPIHRRDVSPLKEASAASNRHEGLALLTTIAEDTGSCNPSPLLPNHLALEKRLISKILVLREALDLPCRSSCHALDQLLLDTLEALKITYPKCLSGLSGNSTTSEQQGLVHLRKVLMSVQDCQAERSELSNLGFEKQAIIETEGLDRIGEHVAMLLDQVIPVAKEIFSFMESSTSAKGSAAAAVRPEKRSLPPVLCRTRSLIHRRSVGHHPSDSDSAEVATPCQDGAMRHRKQLKIEKPVPRREADEGGCSGEGGQTSRRDPPSTPTGDSVLLQSTPSSLSPPPLSAPPPSPVPLLGMPMLLQSWEAMQDDNASSPAVAVPAPTAQQDTVDVDGSALSASMEAGQPSSPSSMDGNAAVPSAPPTPMPTPPIPAHGDKPAEVVASASSSPPQGGPPAINASRAPPPPPPGSISAALRAKKTAGKLKRSTQMGTLYRHLRDRVEGPCTHGGGKRQAGNKPRTPGGSKGEAGQGMADALAEMTKRSAYFRQIEEDAENHAAAILELKDAISSFESRDMAELVRFHQHVEQQLVCLTDETQVLARFEGFPSKKLESLRLTSADARPPAHQVDVFRRFSTPADSTAHVARPPAHHVTLATPPRASAEVSLRMASALYSKLDGTVSKLKGWKLAAPLSNQLDRVEGYFNKIKDDVDMIERNKDEEAKRFLSHNIHFDFAALVRIKECMVDLSSNCMEQALKESKHARETSAQSPGASPPSRMLWRVFQLAFRVYNFAGGQDERADRLTATLAHEIEAHPL